MVLYRKKRYKCPQNSIQTNSYFDTKKNHEPIEITRKFKYLNYIYSVSIGGPGDPDPQSGAAAPDPRGKPERKPGPLYGPSRTGVVFFCPAGKKISTPGPRGPPLTVLPWAALWLRRRTSPFQELARRLRQCTTQGRGSGPLSGGTTGADWPAPYGPPARPSRAGRLPLPFPRPASGPAYGPLRRGRGPGSGKGSRRRRNGPRRAGVAPGV